MKIYQFQEMWDDPSNLANAANLEVDMEAYEFLKSIKDYASDIWKWVINERGTAEMDSPTEVDSLEDNLKKIGFASLANANVYRSPNVSTPMYKFAPFMLGQMMLFGDIEERLLDPLLEWVHGSLATENGHNKIFADRDLKFVDVGKLTAELKRNYAKSPGHAPEISKMEDEYRSLKDYHDVYPVLYNLNEVISRMNIARINEKQLEIAKGVDELVEEMKAGKRPAFTVVGQKQTARYFKAVAEEIEYMGNLIYISHTLIGAWNNTAIELKKW